MTEWRINIIEYDTGQVVKTLGPYDNARQAERAGAGLTRQLDHERFYAVVMTREQVTEAMRCRFTWEAGVGLVRCERAEGRHESGASWVAAEAEAPASGP